MLTALFVLASGLAVRDSADSWVLFRGGADSVVMSGSAGDVAEARKCLRDAPAGCLWFRRSGRRYVATDAAALQQILDAGKPQEALGEKQAALGEQQAALGEQQSELGGRQGDLGARQGRDPGDPALRKELARLEREQSELGRRQSELGKQQSELGRQQEELSRQVERTVGRLIDALIESGTARELKEPRRPSSPARPGAP